jgi:O-antigen/teichoic acid export membrane protein
MLFLFVGSGGGLTKSASADSDASIKVRGGTLRAFWRRFSGSQFGRQVAVVIGGTAAGQFITLLVSPLLTRLYTPADFGVLNVYVSALSLVVVSAALRYELAIPLPDADEDAANLLALSLLIVYALSAIIAILALAFGPRLLGGGRFDSLIAFRWMLPLSMAAAGTYQSLSFWAMRKQAFSTIARTKISQSIAQAIAQVTIGALQAGPSGLLIGDVIGRSGGAGTLGSLAWRRSRDAFRKVSWGAMRRVANRFRRFPIYSSGSAVFNAATLQLPLLFMAGLFGPRVAGLFGLGQRVLTVPMSLVGNAIANVYYSTLAEAARTNPDSLEPMFVRLTKRLALVGVGPVLCAALFGPWACGVVFGPDWREAGTILRYLSPMLLLQFVASPLGGTLDVLERQDLHLIREILRQVLTIGALAGAKILALDLWHTIALFSAAGTLGNIFYIASTWYALRDVSNRAIASSAG